MRKSRSEMGKINDSKKCVPRVSDEMVTINGKVSEELREVLQIKGIVILRAFDTRTGRTDRYWDVWKSDRLLTMIHEAVIRRWRRRGFATIETGSPTDSRPSKANEYCEINRCERCGHCGIQIDQKTWLCNDCSKQND